MRRALIRNRRTLHAVAITLCYTATLLVDPIRPEIAQSKKDGALTAGGKTGRSGAITINWSSPQQTIDGFGAAAVDFAVPLTNSLADFFFSTIGLSILRVQVIPDTATCNALCRSYGLRGGTGCSCEASNGATILTGELQTIRQAQDRGVRIFFASSWSPPGTMKSNGNWMKGGSFLGGTNNYASYAALLTGYVALLSKNGVSLFALSPQNEPDVPQSYQSCTWTPQQLHDFIPYLHADLQAAGFGGVKIMFPENDSSWSSSYGGFASLTMDDPRVAPDVGILAQHSYGSGEIVAPSNYGRRPHVWMTEGSSQSPSYNGGMSDALGAAATIHRYLAIANVNAFVWWFLTDMRGQGSGNDNSALTGRRGNIPKRAYVTGNWSKFVRPGWHRVGVTNNGPLLVSAFQSPDCIQSAVVVVNSGSTAANQNFEVGTQMGASVTCPWVTSSKQSLKSEFPVKLLVPAC